MADRARKLRRKIKPREGGGASVLGFGITRPKAGLSQQEVVRNLVLWLESRRALSHMYEAEGEWYVNQSILGIREQLVERLEQLDRGDEAWGIARGWRDQCNAYLTSVPDPSQVSNGLRPHVAEALTQLRGSFRDGLLSMAEDYDLPEASDLADKIAAGTGW